MWSVWSTKGGSGASVVCASLAVLAARVRPTLLVDLGCDQPALLGQGPRCRREPDASDDPEFGLLDWLEASSPPPDALARLELTVGPQLSLLPAGDLLSTGHPDGPGAAGDGRRAERLDVLGRLLSAEERAVVVDVGTATHRFEAVLARSHASILVTRACYLALRRPIPVRHVDRVVLVAERGRALRRADVELVLPTPVSATVEWTPAVARAVDAGTLCRRLPRALRSLGPLLAGLPSGSTRTSDSTPSSLASSHGVRRR